MSGLDLAVIAARLEALEETIIHRLIDRAQFAANPPAYKAGASRFPDAESESLFDLRLRYQEEMDAAFGRYQVPEERPLHRDLPPPRRAAMLQEETANELAIEDVDSVNLTAEIARAYLGLLPSLCPDGDDGHHGSSVEHDVLAIQALSRRIHFGALYVAESKYRAAPRQMSEWIQAHDRARILEAITRPDVEARIHARVAEKVDYIQSSINTNIRRRIDPEIVLSLYRDTIIPLTKEGELRYLFGRTPT